MLLGLLEADARYWDTWRRISSRSADKNTEYNAAKVIYLKPHEMLVTPCCITESLHDAIVRRLEGRL